MRFSPRQGFTKRPWLSALFFILGFFPTSSLSQAVDSTFAMLEAESHFKHRIFLAAGYALSGTPQTGAYWHFAPSWQGGLEFRSWSATARTSMDHWPEIGLHLRRIWLAAEENEALRNSEYVEFGLGLFPAYSFALTDLETFMPYDKRLGYRGMLRAAIGQYWMPFSNVPFGLDANVVLGRYLDGHPPGYPHRDLLTLTVTLFWVPDWHPGR